MAQKTKAKAALALLFIFWGSFASAGLTEKQQALQNMGSRPTVSQFLEALTPWPERNPWEKVPVPERTQAGHLGPISEAIPKMIPEAIATMEYLYPGATWAPLGRDAAFLGDLLDLFYHSLGQKNRVARLNGSGNSIRGAQPGVLLKLLQSAGFTVEGIEDRPPFIIFDNTGYNVSSQSRLVVRAGYEAMQKAEVDPQVRVHKLNVLNFTNNSYEPNKKSYFDGILSQLGHQTLEPHSILSIPNGSFFGYGFEWHHPFGAIQLNEHGRWEGAPGPVSSHAPIILSELFQSAEIIRSERFLERVQEAATKLGYVFPLKRDPKLKEITEEERKRIAREAQQRAFNQARERYGDLLNSLPELEEQENYYSNVAAVLVEWVREVPVSEMGNELLLLFMENILDLRAEQRITSKDFRRLLARALGRVEVNEGFLKAFSRLYEGSDRLRKVLDERQGVFLDSNQDDAAEVAATYRALEEAFRCRNVLIRKSQPKEEA